MLTQFFCQCLFYLILIVAFLWHQPLRAERGGREKDESAAAAQKGQKDKDRDSTSSKTTVTRHEVRIGGALVKYKVTATILPVKDDGGKVDANIFHVSYEKEGVEDLRERPVTFAFNGGPGAASMWLHIGALGPRRIVMPENGTKLPVIPEMIDNEDSWLDFTDLVFVDPVGTGFSRAADGVDGKQFYDVQKDVELAGRFIQQYVSKNGRWLSPKFIAGESYGTTRAAGLSGHLQNRRGLDLNGLMLVSSVLNFQTIMFHEGNDLPFVVTLPSMTATAWYHKKISQRLHGSLEQALAESEKWATTEYTEALVRGDTLSDEEHGRIADRLAELTGLSRTYVEHSRLRVGNQQFARELLRDENRSVGLMDSRVKGYELSQVNEYPMNDPAFYLATSPLVAVINEYLRNELKYENDLHYEFLSGDVHGNWKWGQGMGYLNVARTLAEAMSQNYHLKVFNAAGIYDLATSYYSQRYTFDHLGLNPELRKNITFKTYQGGHMFYTAPAELKRLKDDAAQFVADALKDTDNGKDSAPGD